MITNNVENNLSHVEIRHQNATVFNFVRKNTFRSSAWTIMLKDTYWYPPWESSIILFLPLHKLFQVIYNAGLVLSCFTFDLQLTHDLCQDKVEYCRVSDAQLLM